MFSKSFWEEQKYFELLTCNGYIWFSRNSHFYVHKKPEELRGLKVQNV